MNSPTLFDVCMGKAVDFFIEQSACSKLFADYLLNTWTFTTKTFQSAKIDRVAMVNEENLPSPISLEDSAENCDQHHGSVNRGKIALI